MNPSTLLIRGEKLAVVPLIRGNEGVVFQRRGNGAQKEAVKIVNECVNPYETAEE